MKFIIIIKQRGEGCDYTIGCGMTTKIIDAVDDVEAEEKVKEMFLKDYCYGLEYDKSLCDIESITIAPSPESLPIKIWWKEHLEEEFNEERAEKEEKEKIELARLLKKYK